jgi:outer membrane protein assembly factor BamB
VKWAFALDGGISSQPTVVGDRVIISTIPGQLYSLVAATGCISWSYLTLPGETNWAAGARSTVSVGPLPATGELLWRACPSRADPSTRLAP